MRVRVALLVSLAILLSSGALSAQVKPPQDFLGFRVGDDYKLADWQQIAAYFSELDRASDRVRVDVPGGSWRGQFSPGDDRSWRHA